MAVFIDPGIITIYDMENGGEPLENVHRADAREFLAHPSGRWSISPECKAAKIIGAKGKEIKSDSGESIRLKSLTEKALRTMAKAANIEGAERLNKPALVESLLKKEE